MNQSLSLITGATGLVGSHVAEQLVGQGERVRAVVREGSDTRFLENLGVELVRGDLADPGSLRPAVAGADTVYHCAARVTDWGPWRLFRETIIDTTRNLVDACRAAGVGRLLHVSSSRVYGHPRHQRSIAEDEPLGQRLWLWERYPRAKIEAEQIVRDQPVPWTIVRPTWVYGLRDRNTLPRVLRTLQLGQARLIGRGDNPLNIVFASDLAEGIARAAATPAAAGQIYNLSAAETFTQREFLDTLTEALRLPPLARRLPYWLAYSVGFLVEVVGKALCVRRNLRVTRHGVSLLGSAMAFSSTKACQELGWTPKVPPLEGLRRTVAWYFAEGPGAPALETAMHPVAH